MINLEYTPVDITSLDNLDKWQKPTWLMTNGDWDCIGNIDLDPSGANTHDSAQLWVNQQQFARLDVALVLVLNDHEYRITSPELESSDEVRQALQAVGMTSEDVPYEARTHFTERLPVFPRRLNPQQRNAFDALLEDARNRRDAGTKNVDLLLDVTTDEIAFLESIHGDTGYFRANNLDRWSYEEIPAAWSTVGSVAALLEYRAQKAAGDEVFIGEPKSALRLFPKRDLPFSEEQPRITPVVEYTGARPTSHGGRLRSIFTSLTKPTAQAISQASQPPRRGMSHSLSQRGVTRTR